MPEFTGQKTWGFFRALIGGFLRWKFAYSCQVSDLGQEPCIVLANHNTDLDPIFVALAFKRPLTFVASEHVFRKGMASRFLEHVFHPISRKKGTTDAAAGLSILRALRNGQSVCMFAEGNRSFNGETGPVFPATGKLCRISGARLITFRMEGGYLTSPRWARTFRRGRMHGQVVHSYSPETLKSMSGRMVNEQIDRDLYENAFARESENPVPFAGKRLAEGIERAFYLCPGCKKIGTVHGEGNRIRCSCGLDAVYTEYGTLEGNGFPFRNVLEWDRWQTGQMRELADSLQEGETAFGDPEGELRKLLPSHGSEEADRGTISMTREALTVGSTVLPFQEIVSMAVVGPSRLVFTCAGEDYELGAAEGDSFCGRKYLELYEQLFREEGK